MSCNFGVMCKILAKQMSISKGVAKYICYIHTMNNYVPAIKYLSHLHTSRRDMFNEKSEMNNVYSMLCSLSKGKKNTLLYVYIYKAILEGYVRKWLGDKLERIETGWAGTFSN